jgi:hypothetical protein
MLPSSTRAAPVSGAPTRRDGALATCSGERISSIEIYSREPISISAKKTLWNKALAVTGLRETPTRPRIVRAYLKLREGQPCTEAARRESERVLRAQPFFNSATIRVLPDGAGRVRLQVDVVDDIPLLLMATTRGGTPASLMVGSRNLSGLGLRASVGIAHSVAYGVGLDLRAAQYGIFGRPDFASVDLRRARDGDRIIVQLVEPLLTPLQRRAFHLGAGGVSGFEFLSSPTGQRTALFSHRDFWDAAWVTRVGHAAPGQTVGLLGAMLLGEKVYSNADVQALARNGLMPSPDPALVARYPDLSIMNAALVAGLSRVRYGTVSNFDALHADQDAATGVQFGVLAGPSVSASRGASDILFAGDFYAGAGSAGSLVQARVLAESRSNRRADHVDDAVTSAQLSWYHRVSDGWTSHLGVQGAELRGLEVPAQLSLREPDGGVIGFATSHAAGGKRATARLEERIRMPHLAGRADVAVAPFVEAGKLWAGDAPYGVTTPVRTAVGVSLLLAYPEGSRRVYRLDVGFPVNSDHRARVELRLSSSDFTRGLRHEPLDVSRMRSSALPTSLLAW